VVVDAVDQEVVERAAQAVDVEGAFARRPVRALVQRRLADAGRQQGERRVLPAVQRELAHLVAGDHLASLARVGLDERRPRRGAGTVFHRSNDGRRIELRRSTGNSKAQQHGQDQETWPAPKRSHLSPPGSTFRAERTSYRRPVTSWRRPNNSISPKGEVTRNL